MFDVFNPYPSDKWHWWLVTSKLYVTYPNTHYRVISTDDVCAAQDIELSLLITGVNEKWKTINNQHKNNLQN